MNGHLKMNYEFDLNLCGIDEAGRGPLAGPLVVAGVKLDKQIEGLNDSKKLTKKQREKLFDEICANSKYEIVFHSNLQIDRLGLSKCIQNSLIQIMQKIESDRYLFDGNTNYKITNLSNLIKADTKIAQVSAASILAKISRDRFMDDVAPQFSDFDFASHKGYGTKKHIEEIEKFGYTEIHRKSFKLKKTFQTNKMEFID